MMNETRDHLEQFLRRNLAQQRAGHPPEAIAIAHHNGNATISMLGEWPPGTAATDEDERGALTSEILQAAHQHASLLSGPQTYEAMIYWPSSPSSPSPSSAGASTLIRVAGAPAVGQLSPTEPANLAGLVSQLMRHLEAQARINAGLVERQNKTLGDELARKDRRIADLEAARTAQLDALESLALNTHEREIATLKATRAQARLDDGLQSLKLLAPPLVAAVSKRFGGPTLAAQDPELLNLKSWLKSLTRDQLLATLASSTPAQQAALMHAYQELALKDEPGFSDLAKPDEPIQ